jgi:hypothetical protein
MLTKDDLQNIDNLLDKRISKVEKKIDRLSQENRKQHNEIIGHFDQEFQGLRNRVQRLEGKAVTS